MASLTDSENGQSTSALKQVWSGVSSLAVLLATFASMGVLLAYAAGSLGASAIAGAAGAACVIAAISVHHARRRFPGQLLAPLEGRSVSAATVRAAKAAHPAGSAAGSADAQHHTDAA